MEIPFYLFVSYSIFNLLVNYQAKAGSSLSNSSHPAASMLGVLLSLSGLAGAVAKYAFVAYWGYIISWYQAAALFAVSFVATILLTSVIQFTWLTVATRVDVPISPNLFLGVAGFIVMPVCGYYMGLSLP